MVLLRYRAALLPIVLLALVRCASAAEPNCRVVNLMPEYWRVVDSSNGQTPEQKVQEFRKALVAAHEDLYGKGGLGFESAKSLDAAIVQALADSRRHESEIKANANVSNRSCRRISRPSRRRSAIFVATSQSTSCIHWTAWTEQGASSTASRRSSSVWM
jgi:hypothetical protein